MDGGTPLRVVAMTAYLPSYRIIADWAERNGHEIVLIVTPPVGASSRYGAGGNPFVQTLPVESSVLMTGKLRAVAAAVIAAIQPDLIISAAFPRLIPAEILEIPKYGALNLHPSRLPKGRGPNPARLIYEGATTVDATVHRTEKAFDTGAILAQRQRPLPDDLTGPTLLTAWVEMLDECLEEAAAKAVAGEPGLTQNSSEASEAPMFTDAELVLDLSEPIAVVRRQVAALNLFGPRAQAVINGAEVVIHSVHAELSPGANGAPGTVLAENPDGWTIQTKDGVLRVVGDRR